MSGIKMTTDQITQEWDLNNAENIIYVGNIDTNSTEEELKEFFKGINILNWNILKNPQKCYAFVEVGCKRDIDKIVKSYDGKLFKTRKLILRSYKHPNKKSMTDGSPNEKASQKTKSKKSKKNSAIFQIDNSKQLNHKPESMPPLEDIGYILQENKNNSKMNTSSSGLKKVLKNDYETVFLENGIRLIVGNFPYGTSENDLMELFHPVNPLFAVIKNTDNKKYSTQGFIFFWSVFDMKRAVEKFDKSTYKGHILLVTSPYVDLTFTKNNFSNSFESAKEIQENTMASDHNSSVRFHKEAARLFHIYKEFSLESELLTNEIVVCVTRVVNTHCFWAHVVGEKNERCKEFMSIHKCLQETAFSWKKTKSIGRCVAMYCGKWLRGYILKIISSECAEVFLVDAGNITEINFQFLRLSPDSIWKLSPMARSFKIPEGFNALPENAAEENLSLDILKLETASSGYITLVKIKG